MLKTGDRIVVTSHLSSFYGRQGTLESINFLNIEGRRTPMGYLCRIDGYSSVADRPIPFMENEIQASRVPLRVEVDKPL